MLRAYSEHRGVLSSLGFPVFLFAPPLWLLNNLNRLRVILKGPGILLQRPVHWVVKESAQASLRLLLQVPLCTIVPLQAVLSTFSLGSRTKKARWLR